MIISRKANDRGQSQMAWLDSRHTFSFADYYDPAWMHFGFIRVINEDYIQPSQGFGKHPHQNMEIITYVISGALKHQDSLGNGSIIIPGEIQRMSAGTGVWHSEYNHSQTQTLHLLQIWIMPDKQDIQPGYEQKQIDKKSNKIIVIASNNPGKHSVLIHQKIQLSVGLFDKNKDITYSLNKKPGWIQIIKGLLKLNNQIYESGDGIGLKEEEQFTIQSLEDTEFLLFENYSNLD